MIDTQLLTALQNHNKILCISHVGPDGDAVGSLLGMGWLLHYLGKSATLALQDDVPESFLSLPGADSVRNAKQVQAIDSKPATRHDLIIVLDASSADRMGKVYAKSTHSSIPMVVIDHHVTNTYFGDYNWVAPTCAATCQMLVQLADRLSVPLEGPLAECLLTGLVTDTLCFRTSNTDADVLECAMRLMRGGADLAVITERTLNRRPFSILKLWGIALSQTELEEGVIWATVSRADQTQAGVTKENDVQLASTLVTATEADMSAVFTEKLDRTGRPAVECSFRAKPGFNVSDLAVAWGGGGHPPASGCTISGTLAEVTAQIVPALQDARRSQLTAQVNLTSNPSLTSKDH